LIESKEQYEALGVYLLHSDGGTGAWSKPYADAGYSVKVVDLERGEDVRLFQAETEVHGVLAAPPCTHLAGSGARWWEEKGIDALIWNLSIVDACLRIVQVCKPQWWALENPVGRLVHYLGPPKMYFHPWEYGDPYTKKTCLWGEFNEPKKSPVEPVEGGKMHRMGPSPDRAKLRSITPAGFAQAFFEANP
jgi:hypothetical protein